MSAETGSAPGGGSAGPGPVPCAAELTVLPTRFWTDLPALPPTLPLSSPSLPRRGHGGRGETEETGGRQSEGKSWRLLGPQWEAVAERCEGAWEAGIVAALVRCLGGEVLQGLHFFLLFPFTN